MMRIFIILFQWPVLLLVNKQSQYIVRYLLRSFVLHKLVMGRVCITVNLLIDQNNILYLSAISRMTISVVCWRAEGPYGFSTPRLRGGGGGVPSLLLLLFSFTGDKRCRRRRRWLYQVVCSRRRWRRTVVGCR